MKFLTDAHLPPTLASALRIRGYDAVHTRDLAGGNQTRDGLINEISIKEQRVVITKDNDFFYSHVLQERPWKLILVRTGNIGAKELRALFERNLSAILTALENHTLIEIDRNAVSPIG